jgi:hypothetical protein
MSIPHPNNRTWKDGLLRTVSLARGQMLEATPNQPIQHLIFHQHNASIGAKDPANLLFKQAVRPNQPFRVPLWGAGNIVCIAVDLTQRYADFELTVYSKQGVKGDLKISIGYQVQNPLEVAQRPDVLYDLWRYCQEAAQRVTNTRSHTEVAIDEVRDALRRVNSTQLGLAVVNVVMPHPIFWEGAIAKVDTTIAMAQAKAIQSRNVMHTQMETDRQRREIIERELARYGISDVETIAEVSAALDRNEPDLARAIKKVLDGRRDRRQKQEQKDLDMIEKLAERDKLDSFNWQDLGQGAIDRLNRGRHDEQQALGPRTTPQRAYPAYDPNGPRIETGPLPYHPNASLPPGLPQTPGYGTTVMPNPEYPQETPPPTIQGAGFRKLIDYGQAPGQASHAALFDLTHHTGSFVLSHPITYLGRRARDNHIIIADDRVSRQHSIIEFQGDTFYIRNHEQMHSEVDTLVNGIKVGTQRIALYDGSEIMIGEARLQFRFQRGSVINTPPFLDLDDSDTRFG